MDSISWATMVVAVALGVVVGAVILGAGIWIDKARERRWQRELSEPAQVRDLAPGALEHLRERLSEQRGDDGA